MSNFGYLFGRNWPVMLAQFGESATYHGATGDVVFTAVINGRDETQTLDVTWEVAARQIEVFAAASDIPADTRLLVDEITARGATYTVIERVAGHGTIIRLLCERSEVETVQHRGRRY